jgi:hypothetical protein
MRGCCIPVVAASRSATVALIMASRLAVHDE